MLETLDVDKAVDAKPRGVWYVDSPEFHEPGAKTKIRRPIDHLYTQGPDTEDFSTDGELKDYANTLHHPILTHEAERYFFRLMNFTRFQMNNLILSVDGNLNSLKPQEQRWLHAAEEKSLAINNGIASLNIRLCAHWAKKLCKPGQEDVRDLFEEFHVPLESCIRRFNYAFDTKFSTFASDAMQKHVLRLRSYAHRDATHFPTGLDLSQTGDRSYTPDGVRSVIKDRLIALIDQLPDQRLQAIVKDYYALNGSPNQMTHEEIGHKFGVTKERSRQLLVRAQMLLQKLIAAQKLHDEDFVERIPWNELEEE